MQVYLRWIAKSASCGVRGLVQGTAEPARVVLQAAVVCHLLEVRFLSKREALRGDPQLLLDVKKPSQTLALSIVISLQLHDPHESKAI